MQSLTNCYAAYHACALTVGGGYGARRAEFAGYSEDELVKVRAAVCCRWWWL